MEWLKYDFHHSDILRETEKSYLIAIGQEFHNGAYAGDCVWIPKRLTRFNNATNTYNAVVGDDFKIKVLGYEADFRGGNSSVDILQTDNKDITAKEFIKKSNEYQKIRNAERIQNKLDTDVGDKLQKEHTTLYKKKKAYEADKGKLSEAQAKQRLASIARTEAKIKELKAEKKLLQTKPQTIRPIKHSKAIERNAEKYIKTFSKKVNHSLKYWTLAQFNKFNRNEVNNLANTLKVEFSGLKKQWSKVANDFSKAYAWRMQKSIKNYVDSNYISQNSDYKLKGVSSKGKDILKATYLQNIALIKSIPNEIIRRYESAFYNSVASFDSSSIEKLAKNISHISNNRAKFIARDQTSKAIESFSMARANQLGFEFYEWQTSEDERVSTGKGGHRQLNGRLYRYDEPSAIIDSYGNKGHPTQRPNCRCVSVAVIIKPNQSVELVKDSVSGDYYKIIEK